MKKQQPIYAMINAKNIAFKCTFPEYNTAGTQATVEHLMILLGYDRKYTLSFDIDKEHIITVVKCYATKKGYKYIL